MVRTYSELIKLPTFEERLSYLLLSGKVGAETFGFDRWLNQHFYKSEEWKKLRRQIIIRDNGCDLAVQDYIYGVNGEKLYKYEIQGSILVHHMNPIAADDIVNCTPYLMNPDFLISTSFKTHQALHYERATLSKKPPIYLNERKPNDTCPWKK